jgi:hypothetical protein
MAEDRQVFYLLNEELAQLSNELASLRETRTIERFRRFRYQAVVSAVYTTVNLIGNVIGASVTFTLFILVLSRLEVTPILGQFISEVVRAARTHFPP